MIFNLIPLGTDHSNLITVSFINLRFLQTFHLKRPKPYYHIRYSHEVHKRLASINCQLSDVVLHHLVWYIYPHQRNYNSKLIIIASHFENKNFNQTVNLHTHSDFNAVMGSVICSRYVIDGAYIILSCFHRYNSWINRVYVWSIHCILKLLTVCLIFNFISKTIKLNGILRRIIALTYGSRPKLKIALVRDW